MNAPFRSLPVIRQFQMACTLQAASRSALQVWLSAVAAYSVMERRSLMIDTTLFTISLQRTLCCGMPPAVPTATMHHTSVRPILPTHSFLT